MDIEIGEVLDCANTFELFVNDGGERKRLMSFTPHYYNDHFWTEEELVRESIRLQKEYTRQVGENRDIDYFRNFHLKTHEKYQLQKFDEITIQFERTKSFLAYHILTLRSIGKLENKEEMIKYINNEIVQFKNIQINLLYGILDKITEKRNKNVSGK